MAGQLIGVFAGFPITVKPSEKDWQFLDAVSAYQSQMSQEIQSKFKLATPQLLASGMAEAYVQEIETSSSIKEKMAVEISQILISVPFEKLEKVLPTHQWGTYLAHYLGGEVQTIEQDSAGRPIRQIERMVMSGLPFNLDANFANQDMTKAEVLIFGPTSNKVYWRVYHSDNRSTIADLGSVEFRSYPQDNSKTLVTFHSAHRIQALGLEIPASFAGVLLRKAFLDHLRHYKKMCESTL